MELSAFGFRLLLLFFPGIIAAKIVDTLSAHEEKRSYDFFLTAFLFGVFSYLLLAVIYAGLAVVSSDWSKGLVFFSALTDTATALEWTEILWASFCGTTLGLVAAFAGKYKALHRFARWLGVTNVTGEADLWAFVFNSPDVGWVTVRDRSRGLSYEGWVQGFSANVKRPELLLSEVKVYDSDSGEELYGVGTMYLAPSAEDLILEIPQPAFLQPGEAFSNE